jgi:hypothetical protein
MNILSFHLNVPAEVVLERPEGTLVPGRYGDRVMFTLGDGRVMYVPPHVAGKIEAEGVVAGEPFHLCKTQVKRGNQRTIEWTVRRLDAFEEPTCTNGEGSVQKSLAPNDPKHRCGPVRALETEPETPLEHELRASIESVAQNGNGNGQDGKHVNATPAAITKLEHALKTAISAAYNAERYGAELGYVVRFDADAIKSMAITVLINMSGANHR